MIKLKKINYTKLLIYSALLKIFASQFKIWLAWFKITKLSAIQDVQGCGIIFVSVFSRNRHIKKFNWMLDFNSPMARKKGIVCLKEIGRIFAFILLRKSRQVLDTLSKQKAGWAFYHVSSIYPNVLTDEAPDYMIVFDQHLNMFYKSFIVWKQGIHQRTENYKPYYHELLCIVTYHMASFFFSGKSKFPHVI